MAELTSSFSKQIAKAGQRKQKKLSTRVDLTPMVDLGFLLITFFIFTTTLNTPTTMRLVVPKDDENDMPVKESAVITFLPSKGNRIWYYEGKYGSVLKITDFKAVRDIILDKKSRTDSRFFEVILKPSPDATYKNTVDILDEMTINAVSHYTLANISAEEYASIK